MGRRPSYGLGSNRPDGCFRRRESGTGPAHDYHGVSYSVAGYAAAPGQAAERPRIPGFAGRHE